MENLAEEYIKALQTSIEARKNELESTGWWNPLQRKRLKNEIYGMQCRLKPLLRQAQAIRQ